MELSEKDLKNYNYLVDSFTRMGFDGVFDDALKTAMLLGKPEILLKAEMDRKEEKMDFTLKLERSDDQSLYFLNNVKVNLYKENAQAMTHDFLFYKISYNIEQMYNIMKGRAVQFHYRYDDRNVEMWRSVDFSSFDDRGNTQMQSTYPDGNFKLSREVNKLPVQNMTSVDKDELIDALKNGYAVPVLIRQGSDRIRVFVEAAPKINALKIFNEKGERIHIKDNRLKVVAAEEKKTLPEQTRQIVQQQQQQTGQQTRPAARKVS